MINVPHTPSPGQSSRPLSQPSKGGGKAKKKRRPLSQPCEQEVREALAAAGLSLRVCLPPKGARGPVHWLVDHADGEQKCRVLECWPSSGTWWCRALGERGRLDDLQDLAPLAASLAARILQRDREEEEASTRARSWQQPALDHPAAAIDLRAATIDELHTLADDAFALSRAIQRDGLGDAGTLARLLLDVQGARQVLCAHLDNRPTVKTR